MLGGKGNGAQKSIDNEIDLRELWKYLNNGAQNNDVIDFHKFWLAFKRRKKLIIVVIAGVMTLSVAVTAYQRVLNPVYQGSFTLLIDDPINNQGGNNNNPVAGEGLFEQLARNTTNPDIPTLIETLKSSLLLRPIAESFQLNENALSQRIRITTGGVSRKEAEGVLKVSLTSRNPQKDQLLLVAISKAYLNTALDQRQKRLVEGISFLNQQAPSLQAKANEIQIELADFRRRHSLLEPSVEGAALRKREAELSTQILVLEAERSRLKRVRQEVSSGNLDARGFQEAISTGDTRERAGVQGLAVSDSNQSLLQQLTKVETQLAEARSKFQPSSAMVRSLEARLDRLQPLLLKNQLGAVDTALKLNYGRLTTARNQQIGINQQFQKQPALVKEYEALQIRLTLAQGNLAGLVNARETFQLELAQQLVPWRVIEPPKINPVPIKPSVPLNLALGMMLGILAGGSAGLLRDMLDNVYHNSTEVKDNLGISLLGHIPNIPYFQGVHEYKSYLLQEIDNAALQGGEPAIQNSKARNQHSFYQEAFNNLIASIHFLKSDQPLRTVALTSTLPAEGKSLVNVLLAKTYAEMGQRVLLIDADLRKPKIHTCLGLNNLSGLTNLLSDNGQHWCDVVQNMPGYDNWSVITAGQRPPNPTRLLSSKLMHNLVHELSECDQYDLVLIDTSPVLDLADGVYAIQHCDGVMLLVSLGDVDRGLTKQAMSRISSSRTPLIGLVTNAIKPESDKSAKNCGYGSYEHVTHTHYADEDSDSNAISNSLKSDNRPHHNWLSKVKQRTSQLMHWINS